jgi:hypothetical protein
MDAGLVVVLAVTGAFLLVPLAFAWVSTNPRRWARVEGVLGREPSREVRWAPWFWIGLGAIYLAFGIVRLRGDSSSGVGWLIEGQGALYVTLGVASWVLRRRLRREAASGQPQIQDRAEPGRPRPGG